MAEEPSHEFTPISFKTIKSSCDFCNGYKYLQRGYKCRVCCYKSHKDACAEGANAATNCSQWLHRSAKGSPNSKPRLEKMKTSKRQIALGVVIEKARKEPLVKVFRADAFLSIICTLPSHVDKDEFYDCFRGKEISPVLNEKIELHLKYNGDQVHDVISYIVLWIQKSDSINQKTAAQRLLLAIAQNDNNKQKIVEDGHAESFSRIFFPSSEERGCDESNPEEMKMALLSLTILRTICNTKDLKFQLAKNKTLDRVITYLKEIKKKEQPNGKKIPYKSELLRVKENRELLRKVRDEGVLLLKDYYDCFYDKDRWMTQYLCDQLVLDLLMDGAAKSFISIYPKISPEDVELVDESNPIYFSDLCYVFVGKYKGKCVAVKVLNPGRTYSCAHFRKEATMLTLIKHPNACPFYGACEGNKNGENETPTLERSFFVMPYYVGGSLASYVENRVNILKANGLYGSRPVIDTACFVSMAVQMANAITFLHSRSIIHRDIKPGNFLIDDEHVIKVCDFGVSRALMEANDAKMTCAGTCVYMAPEVYELHPYSVHADTYSFGLVLWVMITGEPTPYKKYQDSINFLSIICKDNYREPIPSYTLPAIAQLIQKCWHANQHQRPDFNEILEELYSIQQPHVPNRYYAHMYDNLSSKELQSVFSYLNQKSISAFAVTCKKFHKEVCEFRTIPTPSVLASSGSTPRSPTSPRHHHHHAESPSLPPLTIRRTGVGREGSNVPRSPTSTRTPRRPKPKK